MDVCTEPSTCTKLQITIWLFNICVFGVLNQQCRAACVCIGTLGIGKITLLANRCFTFCCHVLLKNSL